MTDDPIHADVDLTRLQRFESVIEAGLSSGAPGPIRSAFKQWALRLRSFLQERFVQFSRGGGDWPKLKYKRKRGSKERAAILRDTNTMFAALNPVFRGQPGALEETISYGIRVGFGGPAQHPNGTFTVADLAGWHHAGAGHLPVRTIIVDPPLPVQDKMGEDMGRALQKVADSV